MRQLPCLLLLTFMCGAAPRTSGEQVYALPLHDGRHVLSHLVVGEHLSATEQLAVERLTNTARTVFGFELPVTTARQAVNPSGAIVLGTPGSNPLTARFKPLVQGLSPEGFVV